MIEEEIEEGGREGEGKKQRDEGRKDREEVVIKIKEKKGEKGEKMRVRDMKEKNRQRKKEEIEMKARYLFQIINVILCGQKKNRQDLLSQFY